MKAVKKIITLACVFCIFAVAGCEKFTEEKIIESNGEKNMEQIKYISMIPEEYRYMFESGVCEGQLPEKLELSKIALSKCNAPDFDGWPQWHELFIVIDLETSSLKGEAKEYSSLTTLSLEQEYELDNEEIEQYLNLVQESSLINPILTGGAWRIALEYKDGSCYSYEYGAEGYNKNSDVNKMLRVMTSKLNIPEDVKKSSSLD